VKKIKYILFLVIGLLLNTITNAQISGYCGKKYIIRYDNFSHPVITEGFDEDPGNGVFLRARHALSFEATTSRKNIVGLTLQMYSFYAGTYNWTSDFSDEFLDLSASSSSYDKKTLHGYIPIVGVNAGIYKKYFLNDWIAPLGGYFKFGVLFNYFYVPDTKNVSYSTSETNSFSNNFNQYLSKNNLEVSTVSLSKKESQFYRGTILFGVGSQRVYWNNIIVDIGMEFGLGAKAQLTFLNLNKNSEIRQRVEERVFRYHLINFNLGIGYLF